MIIRNILYLSMILGAPLNTKAQSRGSMINSPTQALSSECPEPMAKKIDQKESAAYKKDIDFKYLIENISSKKTSKSRLYFKNKNQANKKIQDLLKSMKQYISTLPGCIGCNEKNFYDISNEFKKNLALLISEGNKISQLTVIGKTMHQVHKLFKSKKIFGKIFKAGETKHVHLPDSSNCFILKITLLDKQDKNKNINIGFSQSFSIFYFQSK